jgi:hypothetical protein
MTTPNKFNPNALSRRDAEMMPISLAKVMIVSKGEEGWSRILKIDGHEVSLHDSERPAGVRNPEHGYMTRFAVFEFSRHLTELRRRAELDQTIRYLQRTFLSTIPSMSSWKLWFVMGLTRIS